MYRPGLPEEQLKEREASMPLHNREREKDIKISDNNLSDIF